MEVWDFLKLFFLFLDVKVSLFETSHLWWMQSCAYYETCFSGLKCMCCGQYYQQKIKKNWSFVNGEMTNATLHGCVSFEHQYCGGNKNQMCEIYQSDTLTCNDDEVVCQQPPTWCSDGSWSSSQNDSVPFSRYLNFSISGCDPTKIFSNNSFRVPHRKSNNALLFKTSIVGKYSLKLFKMSFILLLITIAAVSISLIFWKFISVSLGVRCRCRI